MDQEKIHEGFLGIATKGKVYTFNDHEEYNIYEPTSYSGLMALFEEFELKSTDKLVDFGCGLGRVLFYCNQRFLCRVTGIEADKELYQKLLDNKAYYSNRFRERRDEIEVLCGNAVLYDIAPEDNVFYFFNPFTSKIFWDIIEKIDASVKEHPRMVTIIMYYPDEEYKQLLRNRGYVLYRLIKLPEYHYDSDEKMYIYRNYM